MASFLELVQSNFKPSVYDFYVADAKLLTIQHQTAKIFLNRDFKKEFWEKNFEELMVAASFEVYGEPITIQYQFTEETTQYTPQNGTIPPIENSIAEAAPAEILPTVHPDIKPQYTFENFVQGTIINGQKQPHWLSLIIWEACTIHYLFLEGLD